MKASLSSARVSNVTVVRRVMIDYQKIEIAKGEGHGYYVRAVPRDGHDLNCLKYAATFAEVQHFIHGLIGLDPGQDEFRHIFPFTIHIEPLEEGSKNVDLCLSLAPLLLIVAHNSFILHARFEPTASDEKMFPLPLFRLLETAINRGWDFTDAPLTHFDDEYCELIEVNGLGKLVFDFDVNLEPPDVED